jgi:hypothetical protein
MFISRNICHHYLIKHQLSNFSSYFLFYEFFVDFGEIQLFFQKLLKLKFFITLIINSLTKFCHDELTKSINTHSTHFK